MKLISRLLHYLCLSLNPDVLPMGLGRGEDCSSQSFKRTQPLMMGKARMLCSYRSKLVISSLHSRNKEEDRLVARGGCHPEDSRTPVAHLFRRVSAFQRFYKVLKPPQNSATYWKTSLPTHEPVGTFHIHGDLPQGLQQVLLSVRAVDSSH